MNATFYRAALPENAQLVACDDVWIESEAIEQLCRVSARSGCRQVVAMPDIHPGHGSPIGAVYAFDKEIHPSLIGGDAGCGVRLAVATTRRLTLDKLERRLSKSWHEPLWPDADPHEIFHAAWHGGARGLANVNGMPETIAELAEQEPDRDSLPVSSQGSPLLAGQHGHQIGTTGGGNHFVEISRVKAVEHDERAAALGLIPGATTVIAHSGSRGLGQALAKRWQNQVLCDQAVHDFVAELAGVLRYAEANRFALCLRGLRGLGAMRVGRTRRALDISHNDVRRESHAGIETWVHRKGAAPAYDDSPTILLGSRGSLSWVLWGRGNGALLASVAHGAGRRMTRCEARSKLSHKYTRQQVKRTPLGGRVLCGESQLLFEEHPDAYKAVEPVVASVIAAGLADGVASLEPLVTVKQ